MSSDPVDRLNQAIADSRENKYLRDIASAEKNNYTAVIKVDVYAVLEAYDVRCSARQHAVKKLLCAGLRGKGSTEQDLIEALESVQRAIELEQIRSNLDGSS